MPVLVLSVRVLYAVLVRVLRRYSRTVQYSDLLLVIVRYSYEYSRFVAARLAPSVRTYGSRYRIYDLAQVTVPGRDYEYKLLRPYACGRASETTVRTVCRTWLQHRTVPYISFNAEVLVARTVLVQ